MRPLVPTCRDGRKVRTPQGTVVGNAHRAKAQGKCHREQTADGSATSGPQARVKRCGKSAPLAWRHAGHGKPHREQGQIGDDGVARAEKSPGLAARVARQRATSDKWPRPFGVTGFGLRPARRLFFFRAFRSQSFSTCRRMWQANTMQRTLAVGRACTQTGPRGRV